MSLPAFIAAGLVWFLLWLFARAAVQKIGAPGYYRRLMIQYVGAAGAAGAAGAGVAAWLVAALEAGIALSLLSSYWRVSGLVMAACLLVAYACLMASRILRGESAMDCGCAGPESYLALSWWLVGRNLACAAIALLAAASAELSGLDWVSFVLSLAVAATVISIYVTCEQMLSNAQWMEGDG